ncbi:MAG: hypothetical protein GY861_13885 [bacterium]|nr:hypothetical protein [bacterium]
MGDYKKQQRFKKICPNTICATDCTSMFYSHAMHRWCYDENYALKKDTPERTRINGTTSNVMTGTIWQSKGKGETENDSYLYEKNMTQYNELTTNTSYLKALNRVADTYGIQSNSLTASIIKELT